MTVVKEASGSMPQLVRVAEYPENQLFQFTDENDPQTGKPLTVFEMEKVSEMIEYGGDLFMHMNGYGSAEAHEHNTRVKRTGKGVVTITLLSRRPTPEQLETRYRAT